MLRTLAVLSGLSLAPCFVAAQDFYHGGVSAETAARGGIYNPDGANVLDAIALNPAGLTAITAPSTDTMLFAGLARGSFSNSANGHSATRLRPGFGPIGAAGTRLGHSRWSVGVAILPDFS